LVLCAVAVNATNCDLTSAARLIARHWKLAEPSTIDSAGVLSSFQTGFGPTVKALPGFEAYIGAAITYVNSNETRNTTSDQFFVNVFDTTAHGQTAQDQAASFVTGGTLNGKIVKSQFLQADITFMIASSASQCVGEGTFSGYHMATRYWVLSENATLTTAQVAAQFQSGFGPTISAQTGFVLYVGATVDDGTSTHNFFFNVFTTAAGAASANALASAFVSAGTLSTEITKVEFTESTIGFHILAAAANGANGRSSASAGVITTMVIVCATIIAAIF